MFWIYFILAFIAVFALNYLIQFALRKQFNIEKRKIFGSNHVNRTHKIIERTISITFAIVTPFIPLLQTNGYLSLNFFFMALLLYLLTVSIINAHFEKNYSDKPKQAILSISDAAYFSFVILAIMQFGLLDFI
ncbi:MULTISPECIES: DUF4181 domain-containing protein [Bacillaceae]|uniref:DUF4181 domain-containing protein n=1 Tax=Evansella alkalicola TaxID=745819 RepID=A0ABS6JVB6_9BACI|nr:MULTISPECIES: DUF4181 domain-containing protein [Bacillaceae]MBU9722433.1 DUF4181 domain-containing protein [Bacillus alkalicola]